MAPAPTSECLSEETIANYLDGALVGDGRASIEAHIVRCSLCRGVVASAACGALLRTGDRAASIEEPPAVTGEDESPDILPGPGDMIAGKYLVEEYLGSGNMGWVLAARHVDLGQRVAIKVLRPTGSEAARRFLVEAQTSARLSHPHIPRVFDLGRLPGGAPFMVMEYLVGKDLAQVAADGPVSVPDAVRYVIEACAGLGEAHAAGIVHRDLKPANLFLASRPGEAPVVKVLDFGISKVARASSLDTSGAGGTLSGVAVGSPLYMSPEQMRARRDVDARSDIWSLGVILYQLTTGRLPFQAAGLTALAVAIAVDTPPPPSSFARDFPQPLERIILKCLSKLPEARYADVAALARDLVSFNGAGQMANRRCSGARPVALGLAIALLGIGATVALVRLGRGEAAMRSGGEVPPLKRLADAPTSAPPEPAAAVTGVAQPAEVGLLPIEWRPQSVQPDVAPAITRSPLQPSESDTVTAVASVRPSPHKSPPARARSKGNDGLSPKVAPRPSEASVPVPPRAANAVGPLDTPD